MNLDAMRTFLTKFNVIKDEALASGVTEIQIVESLGIIAGRQLAHLGGDVGGSASWFFHAYCDAYVDAKKRDLGQDVTIDPSCVLKQYDLVRDGAH